MPSQQVPFKQDVVLQQDYRLEKQDRKGHVSFRTIPFFSNFFRTDENVPVPTNQIRKSFNRNTKQKHACADGAQARPCGDNHLPIITQPSVVSLRTRGNMAFLLMSILTVMVTMMLIFQYVEDVTTRQLSAKSVHFIWVRLVLLSIVFFVSLSIMTIVLAEFSMLSHFQKWAVKRQTQTQELVSNPYFPHRSPDWFKLVVLMLIVMSMILLHPKQTIVVVMSILFLILYIIDSFYWRSVGSSWFLSSLTATTLITIIVIGQQQHIPDLTTLDASVSGVIIAFMVVVVMWRAFAKKK